MRTIDGSLVRFTSLCLVAVAGTIAGSAHGQTIGGSTPAITMSLEACTDGLEPGVPYTYPLFDPMPAACVDVIGKHMSDKVAANPGQLRSMFRVDPAPWPENLASTTPSDMRSGLFDAFVEADTRLKSSSDVSYNGAMLSFSTPIGGSLIHTMRSGRAFYAR